MKAASVDLVFRPMVASDLAEVHALDKMCFTSPWPLRSFQYELQENPAALMWVVVSPGENGLEDQIVGAIVVWLLVDEVHIATLAVHPDYRQQRIATRLVCTALQECVNHGAVAATLEVRAGNLAAQRLYRRFGFQVVGRRPHYYQDNHEDAVLMTLYNLDAEHLSIIGCSNE